MHRLPVLRHGLPHTAARYLNEEEKVVEKCTLCEQKLSQGELPQCVSQCGGNARWIGDTEAGYESFEGSEDPLGKRRKMVGFLEPFTDAVRAQAARRGQQAVVLLHPTRPSLGRR